MFHPVTCDSFRLSSCFPNIILPHHQPSNDKNPLKRTCYNESKALNRCIPSPENLRRNNTIQVGESVDIPNAAARVVAFGKLLLVQEGTKAPEVKVPISMRR
jgi:hypothetical protein